MRSVTHQNAAALHLLKTFLDSLPSRGEERIDGKGKALLDQLRNGQPPAPTPPAETHPSSPPGLNKPARVAEAQTLQMVATLRAEGSAALRAMAETSGNGDGRNDSAGAQVRPEEPAVAQLQPGTGGGSTPWLNEALAAYSARQKELVRLEPGVQSAGIRLPAPANSDGVKLSPLKVFQKALVYACFIAVVLVLLIWTALLN